MAIRLEVSELDQSKFTAGELEQLSAVFSNQYPEVDGVAEIRLVSMGEIQELNTQYRDLAEPTDVLSFPTIEHAALTTPWTYQPETPLGDIVICPEKADLYKERLIDLAHHGLLHILGFDHEQERVQWDGEEQAIIRLALEHHLTLNPLGHDPI